MKRIQSASGACHSAFFLGMTTRPSFFRKERRARKGQVSIQYMAGFIIFLMVIVYTGFSLTAAASDYTQKLNDNVLRAEAWAFSNNIIQDISTGNNLDHTKIDTFLGICEELNPNNTTSGRLRYKAEGTRSFHTKLTKNPVALTTDGISGGPFGGNLEIEGLPCEFVVVSVGGTDYNSVDISCDHTPASRQEGTEAIIGGVNYIVKQIDANGQFVILEHVEASCGAQLPIGGSTIVRVNRFSVLDNHLAELEVDFW